MLDKDAKQTDRLALFVKTRTMPGKRDQVRGLFQKHLAPKAEANPAQEIVIWCDDEHDPDVFHFFEIYNDRKAFEASSQAPWAAEYMKEVMPLLQETARSWLCHAKVGQERLAMRTRLKSRLRRSRIATTDHSTC